MKRNDFLSKQIVSFVVEKRVMTEGVKIGRFLDI
jgi:hypothetical protein